MTWTTTLRGALYLAAVIALPYAVSRNWTDAATAERVLAMIGAGAVPALAAANLPHRPPTVREPVTEGESYVGRHRLDG